MIGRSPTASRWEAVLGRWVFHCHIFFHAVFGMISEFTVVATLTATSVPTSTPTTPRSKATASDTLTMTGTYADADGDAVALTASVGTITDDGDGVHWTWEHTGAVSGLVYVTATDPDGLASQAVFQLKINQPPVLTVPGPQSAPYLRSVDLRHQRHRSGNDPITLAVVSGLPASLTLTDHGNGTGTVSGNLTVVPGVYVATFSANDGHNTPVTATSRSR